MLIDASRRYVAIFHCLASLLKRYHSFRLIEEAPLSALPPDRGALFACFPHGVFPFGNVLAVPALPLLSVRFVGPSADAVHLWPTDMKQQMATMAVPTAMRAAWGAPEAKAACHKW